jgi:hypothetical protein
MRRIVEMAGLRLQQPHSYLLTAPVSFWWSCSYGSPREGTGITQEISNTGVHITTNDCPPVGTLIQLTVTLPGLRQDGHGMILHGEGIVIQVETSEKAFLASVQFYPESTSRSDKLKRENTGPLGLSVQ